MNDSTTIKTKRKSAGLSRDVKKKMVAIHPVMWERMVALAHHRLGTDPKEIRLTNTQVFTALVTGGEA